MKNKLSYFLLAALFLISVDTIKSQEYYVKSNLENLEIEVGEVFEPSTYAVDKNGKITACPNLCLLYTSPSPRDLSTSRMPSSA